MATVLEFHGRSAGDPDADDVRSLVRVLEMHDGRMIVTSSEGMQNRDVVGNLLMAAIHMAGQNEGGENE